METQYPIPAYSGSPLLHVTNLDICFDASRSIFGNSNVVLKAINNISFSLHAGETLGIVGESGCGKSTLLRAILRLIPITSGSIQYNGRSVHELSQSELFETRKHVRMVFQDSLGSLNPRMTIGDIISEPLRAFYPHVHSGKRAQLVLSSMDEVGLPSSLSNRYPHECSGGQCQRAGIARALIIRPELLICDEPVSSLDVTAQSQIIKLLHSLQSVYRFSMIFVSHDLAVVRHLCQKIMILYLGRIVELSACDDFFSHPSHPYSQALLSAVLRPDPARERHRQYAILPGEAPSLVNPPPGCAFHPRCPHQSKSCRTIVPPMTRSPIRYNQYSCHHPLHD